MTVAAWQRWTGLLGLTLFLAACSTPPVRPPLQSAPTIAPAAVVPVAEEAPRNKPVRDTDPSSPWVRLRQRFALPGCDYRPEVEQWARRYTQHPRRFAATLDEALPFLLLVLDALERRDLPGEFVFLPYVESHYRSLPASGNRPAGIWQLMPATANGQGLKVLPGYDERLDVVASTRGALDLIERYDRQFGDWRVANMAFNAGEFRVKKLLDGRDPATLPAGELAELDLSPTTHEHLDRLLALACITREPKRFGVSLPMPDASDQLEYVELEAAMDLRVAARLAGVGEGKLRRLNPAYQDVSMPKDASFGLLLPARRADQFRSASRRIPVELWPQWKSLHVPSATELPLLAKRHNLPAPALAAANAVDQDATLSAGSRILVPGHEAAPAQAQRTPAIARIHQVRGGDTLGAIARRYGVPLRQLQRWNNLGESSILRPGDRLRISSGSLR